MQLILRQSSVTTMLVPSDELGHPEIAMNRLQIAPRPRTTENELYYLQVPSEPRRVGHDVDFMTLPEFLDDESACRSLWEIITGHFKTRCKFLAIWPSVRYVAMHRRGNEVLGLLLVSAPVNWQIDYVVVRPEWRGRGIAEALVAATLNEALTRKVPYVMLTSREGLRPLYEMACGFTVVAQKPPAMESRTPTAVPAV
jgi:ribosomal protein S18 acetylase RimI-like enzyme